MSIESMQLLGTIFIGFLAGVMARLLGPGSYRAGLLATTLLGIGGAVVATLLGRFLNLYTAQENAGFIASAIGAVTILTIHNFFRQNR